MNTKFRSKEGKAVFGSFSQFSRTGLDENTKIQGNSTFHIVMEQAMCYYVAKEIEHYMHAKEHQSDESRYIRTRQKQIHQNRNSAAGTFTFHINKVM